MCGGIYMKSIMKYLAILLLLSVAIVCIGSSSVTADTSSPLMCNNTTLTISPFYMPTFGVHIFPGADPIGVYSININPDYVYVPHQIIEFK